MRCKDKEQFDPLNLFGTGAPNTACAQYFIGESFLAPLPGGKCGTEWLEPVTDEDDQKL